MKILKVEIRNINSLSGAHVLDFTVHPMSQAGLFAITGPTGSGKSTLLDAITLALYGWTPRTGKITRKEIESSGAVLTRNATDARAAVTYACASGVFLSEWQIEFNSRGNLREHDMKLYACAPDGSDAQITEHLKKSEVPKRNAELIGLDYEQFTRSSLLAQGEFARLLHADATQRSGLLEKITGTSIYRELGRLAFEKGKALTQIIEAIDITLKHEQAQTIGEEALLQLRQTHEKCNTQILALEEEASRLHNSIQAHHRKEKARADFLRKKEAKDEAEDKLNQWKFEFGSAFERHLELERVADDLRRVQSIRVRQQTISEGEHPDLQKEQSLLEGLKMELKEGMLKACARIEPELESSLQFEDGAELVKRLAEFLETATRVETEMSSVRKNILRIEGKLTIDFPELPVEGDLEAWWSETSTSHDSAKLRLEQESDPLSTAEELDREVIDGALAAWEQAEQSLTETLDNLSQLRIDDESWKDEERLLSEAESSASSILQLRKLEAIAAEQAWGLKQIRASLEEHRAALMPGEACPLCGALEHPFSVDVPEIPVEQVGVEQARKAATDAANAHQKIREDRQKLQSKLEHAENRIRELEAKRDELLLSLEKARTDLPSAFMGIEGLSEVQRIWKSHLDLEKAKLGWHTTHLRLQAIRNELDELLKLEREMKNHSADLERHAPEGLQAFKQKVKGWSDSWASIERDESVCQSKVQSLALESLNLEQEMAQLHAELFPEIVACGHDSLASACSCLLPSAEFGRLRATRKELDDICNQAIARWEEAQRQWHELAVPAESLAELEFRQAQISEELEPLRTFATKVLAAIEKEKDRQESIVKLKADRAEKLRGGEKWHLLAREIGSATGDKFNRFAQQLTLEHLIHLANIRLQRLTQRYRLHLAPESEQLAVLDADLAGVPRSVKTLSGGETFLISLGLALALSDLASKNVRIHNLFIDEGFGTLDPETLETTLTVLDLLQADDERSIGVISHVEALKERIAAQVQLIPDGRGNSRIQVQG